MRPIWIASLVLVAIAGWIGWTAYGKWQDMKTETLRMASVASEVAALSTERDALLQSNDSVGVKFAQDALSEFYGRAIEAGEALGAGVRIEARGGGNGFQFQPVKYGLQVAQASLQAAATADAAPPLFSLLEDEIRDMPLSVRSAKAQVMGESVTLELNVDVFGR